MMQNKSILILIGIIFLGASLRFYRIRELTTFRGDQAIELTAAANILKGKFTLIGIKTSNSQLHNGAVMYYLLAPFLYIFNLDPISGGILQSILSLATIPIAYYLGKKFADEKIGLTSAFTVSTSSLLIHFSRQTLLAFYPLFFTSLVFFLINIIFAKFNKFMALFLGILLGFMLQIHYSTLATSLFAYLAPIILLPRKNLLRYYFFITFGFIVGFLPMIVFELRHEFFNTKMFLSLVTDLGKISNTSNFNILTYWLNAISSLFWGVKNIWAGLIICILLVYIFLRKRLELIEKSSVLQIVATFIFTLFFVRQNVKHYTISAFIPLIILTSIAIYTLINKLKNQSLKIFTSIVLILSILLINFSTYGFADNHGWTMDEGWNLKGVSKAAKIIADDVTTTQYNVVMLVDAENQGLPLRYFLGIWGKSPLPVEKYDKATLLYVVAQPKINLAEINMFEINSFGAYTIDRTWPIQNGFTLYRLSRRSV